MALRSPPSRALALLAAALLALPEARAQFTQITQSFLDGAADPADGFGAEDKFAICNGDLVFIDLDPLVTNVWRYRYAAATGAWSKDALTANQCPDLGQGALIPRETGYVVGTVVGPGGGDRLIVMGGASTTIEPRHIENNVYFSDDCGLTWSCYDGQQAWSPREFASVLQARGVLPYDPLVMTGGISTTDTSSGPSIAFFLSYDGGISWQRPECTTEATCRNALIYADTFGRCIDDYAYYKHCYTIPPDARFACSGSLTADWSTFYLHYEPSTNNPVGLVYYLNSSNFGSGWLPLPSVGFGGNRGGRKVFLRGGARGSGCFVSADYLAEDLWIDKPPANAFVSSTSQIQVASSAAGPWRAFTAPWAARAAGALVTGGNATVAYYGSGMTFSGGVASVPTFGDAWMIDASVCLLGANAQVCSGNGAADLFNVACRCAAGFSGALCDQGSAANSAAGGLASSPATTAGGIIGFVVCLIAALVVYNRYFSGRVPQIDGVAKRVDEGVVAAANAAGALASEAVRRARSISGNGPAFASVGGSGGGGGGGGSPGKSPGLLSGGGGGSPASGAYGSL